MNNIVETKMKIFHEERFNQKTKEIAYLYIYKAACTNGFSHELVTEKSADFKIARLLLLFNNKSIEDYKKLKEKLDKLPYGESLEIDSKYGGYLVRIPPFVIINKEYYEKSIPESK